MTVKIEEKPAEEILEEGVVDDPENTTNPEDPDAGSKPAGEQDPDAGGEAGEAGEGAEGDEGEAAESEHPQKIAQLEEQIKELQKSKEQPVEHKPWTDEDWAKHEESTGLS